MRADKRIREQNLAEYGWPTSRRRRRSDTPALLAAIGLVVAAVWIYAAGPETFWTFRPSIEAGMPSWWVPVALLVSAFGLVSAVYIGRREDR